MSFKCCVPNCSKTRADNTILHAFPNPDNDLNRFNRWINAIGREILSFDHKFIFKSCRVCHDHFEPQYYTRSKRLSHNSVPTLHLSGSPTHLVPNPEKHPERFQAWLSLLGKKADASNCELYKNNRVCDIHFANEHRVRNNRLSAIAIPTLYLPGNIDNVMETEMEKSNFSGETTVHSDDTTGNNANVIEVVEIEMDSCSDRQSTAILLEPDIKDNYQSTRSTNISEHNYSMISKKKVFRSEDDRVYNVTTKCNMCNVKIATQYNLHCSLCKHIFDLKCLNMTNETFKNLTKKERCSWICPPCAKQECSISHNEERAFVSLHKRAKILDSKEETYSCSGIKKLKRDIQILKSRMNKFSNTLKQKTKDYDRLLRTKDVEICRLKEIVAELQNCIAKK